MPGTGFTAWLILTRSTGPTYQPPPPVAVPSAAASYVIDILNTDSIHSDWSAAYAAYVGRGLGAPYALWIQTTLTEWVNPWVKNRLILSRMARWKALYLFNGYDLVWSTLQHLQRLANPPQPILPVIPRLKQDNTIANGNWSTLELCIILDFSGAIMNGVKNGSIRTSSGLSVFALLQALANIAFGNWAGPPSYSQPDRSGPTRPLSFRAILADIAR